MRLLSTLFVVSGAAGLIYETVWTRYLSLLVGHSAYAQVLVLVIFLGGMAAGAILVGARSQRLANPLLVYAIVELAIGVIGAAFHPIFTTVSVLAYDHWFPAIGPGTLLTVTKWSIAGALILPQSILLGTTFPLMTAGALRLRQVESGHALGLLYFANSIGAAGGVLLEGFVLLALVGLHGTLLVAALLNLAVAAAVLVTRRRWTGAIADDATPPAAPRALAREDPPPAVLWRTMLAVTFGTALSSFFYEIGWIRMLSLVLGSATHSFEIMLSSFILGLALGAFWIRRRLADHASPIYLLGVTQWAMGVLAVATFPVYVLSFRLMVQVMAKVPETDLGYVAFSLARYAMSLAVMLPATFCAGMTLPLVTRILLGAGFGERAVGMVYGMNTLGSIVGVMIAGLMLLPLIGLKALLVCGAVLDILIGVALMVWDGRRQPPARRTRVFSRLHVDRPVLGALGATAVMLAAMIHLARFDRSVLTSGVYRNGGIAEPGSNEFLYYRDGRTATVSLRRVTGDTVGLLTLSTNGKPDASLEAYWLKPFDPAAPLIRLNDDMATQVLLPLIALAHRAGAERAAVIGQGSGMTSHVLLGSPHLASLETIEIEPGMIRASRGFYPANARVFDDRRSHFVIDDARSVLSASNRSYDLIVAEPSNPWVSGVSGLFAVEFYERVRAQLSPNGVLGQWLHLYEIDDDLVTSVLAAIDRVFPAYDLYMTSNSDLLIVATNGPRLPVPDWSVVAFPALRSDLERVVPLRPEHFAAMRVAGRALMHPLLSAVATPNSDFRPVLDLGAERTRFLHRFADGLMLLSESRFDVAAAVDRRARDFGSATDPPSTDIPRVKALAATAALRAALRVDPAGPGVVFDKATREAVQRYRVFTEDLRGNTTPASWRDWITQFLEVESSLHGGTAGVVDDPFYSGVSAYLVRARAPDVVVASVDFAHGVASWDFDEVNHASGFLVTRAIAGDTWLPLDMLRDGAVLGHWMKGDVAQARDVYHQLAPAFAALPTLRDRVVAGLVGAR